SGLNAALFTERVCLLRMNSSLPLLASHIRAVSSALDVTTYLPLGLNPALFTKHLCPLSTTLRAVLTTHTCAVLSALAVTTNLPLGLNAALFTPPVCPRRVTRFCPVLAS